METVHELHRHTPTLAISDSRGLAVASVGYYRKTSVELPATRRTRETFDVVGRSVANWDARLGAGAQPLASQVVTPGLSGMPLMTLSVDASWRLALHDEAGQVRERWDAAGNTTQVEYDPMGRPLSVQQAHSDSTPQTVERLYYAPASPAASVLNRCGRMIRHADTAGVREVTSYSLHGEPIEESRRFLAGLDQPDWPVDQQQQNALLEQAPGSTYRTHWRYDAANVLVEQIDAAEHICRHAYTVAGQLRSTSLAVAGHSEQMLVSNIAYTALGQVEREMAGNGVISSSVYDPANGRLRQLLAVREEHHLQDLHYDHDPVGNIVRMTDQAQPVRWFANQRIDPVNRYEYDSMYQLISATGREVAMAAYSSMLPELIAPPDPSRLHNYRQSWCYDDGGNLLAQRHSGKPTHFMDIDTCSNRGLNRVQGKAPDFDASFDASGNLRFLAPDQPMAWTARNQLSAVALLTRSTGDNDRERYVYDASGMRVRKVRLAHTANVIRTAEVRYLPGLEIRTEGVGGTAEVLHVISLQAGRSSVRLLHWKHGQPNDIEEDQVRFSLNDHLGSSTLELDRRGLVISYEGYYAYGETAWWMGRSQVEASYKCVRYSGKERDASGLYYYGFRYYAPWLQRWISADPAGIIDGLNLFCMLENSPVTFEDHLGLYRGEGDKFEWSAEQSYFIVRRGRSQLKPVHLKLLNEAVPLALKTLNESISALNADDEGSEGRKRMDKIFTGAEIAKEELSNKLLLIRDVVATYGENGVNEDQFLYVSAIGDPHDSSAFVFPNDDERRIFVSPDFFAEGVISMVRKIIHEASHFIGTQDYFYHLEADGDPRFLSDEYSVGDLDMHLEKMSVARSRTFERISSDIESGRFDDSLKINFGVSDRHIVQAGVRKGGPFSERMYFGNADTLAVAALSIGRAALHSSSKPH